MAGVRIETIIDQLKTDILIAVTVMAHASGAVAGGSATTSIGVSAIVPRMCFDQSDPHRPVDENTEIDPRGKPTGRICNYPVNPGFVLTHPSDPALTRRRGEH